MSEMCIRDSIGIRRLLQLRKLIFTHRADDPVDILIQFPVVDAVHLGQLLLDNADVYKRQLLVFLRNPDACVRYPQTYQPVLD